MGADTTEQAAGREELEFGASVGTRLLALPWLLICLIGTFSLPLMAAGALAGAAWVTAQPATVWLLEAGGWALITLGSLLFWWSASPHRLRLDFLNRTYTVRQGLWPWMSTRTGTFSDLAAVHLRVVDRGRGRVSCRTVLRWERRIWGFTLRDTNAVVAAEAWARGMAGRLGVPFTGVFHVSGYAGTRHTG